MRGFAMKNRLLVVSPEYSTFVKDQTDLMSDFFKKITVLVRYNPLVEAAKFLPSNPYNNFSISSRVNLLGTPKNVNLALTPVYYLPIDSQYKNIGVKHFKSADRVVVNKKLEFDIIHAHHTWSSGYVGAKLKEKYEVPFVVTAHGYDIYDLPFRDDEWRSKIEYVLNSADVIITVSNSNLECIKKLNVKTPVTVLPNGYREDLFYPVDLYESRKSLSLPLDKKVILSVGNLEKVKGHKYLIEAMGHIVKKRQDVICFIVGGGTLEGKLNNQIKSAGLQEYVKLVGGKPHSDIPLWMNACDVFVLPSLSEGNPTVMFECLGCGKPFVGTKVGGIPEVITSEDYGLIVEPYNSIKLAESIKFALEKEWNSQQILVYADNYKWENIAKCILQIHQNTLNSYS